MSREKVMEGIDLPPNDQKLNYATTVIEKFKKRVVYHKSIRAMSEKEYIDLHTLIVQVLEYVGELSMPAFNVQEELEKRYYRMYKHAPELAKKLYLEHYHDIHRPFNTLKNRCFTLLEEMDKNYFNINHKHPPKEF